MHNTIRHLLIDHAKAIPEKEVAILLSGGIDSTTVMLALRLAGKDIIAYTFTLDGHISTDFSCARFNARRLGIPFVPVFLPTDIKATYREVIYLLRVGCWNKVSIEVNWCFLHAIRTIKESALALGFGADLLHGMSLQEKLHISKNQETFDRHRVKTFNDPKDGGLNGLVYHCKAHGKRLCLPFHDTRILDWYLGKSWDELNRPKEKAPLWSAFAKELKGLKVKRHTNLQCGDSQIREHFLKVAAHYAPGVGIVKFYNTLRRNYGNDRPDTPARAVGIR